MTKGSPFGVAVPSFLHEVLAPLRESIGGHPLGQVWSSHNAGPAFANGAMNSVDGGNKARVAFRNKTSRPLTLCWIGDKGEPHKFYSLQPSEVVEGDVTAREHLEQTFVGHAFAFACYDDQEDADAAKRKQFLDPCYVIGGYRPNSAGCKELQEKNTVHLVTISQKPARNFFCFSPGSNLRGSKKLRLDNDICFEVEAREAPYDDTQIDTKSKVYEQGVLGGWPVRAEPDWHGGDEELKRRFTEDLEIAANYLPEHARKVLRENTPVYINGSFSYGPVACPINGKGACFHPDESDSWLETMCMSPQKCNCIEFYDTKTGYVKDCDHWGRGGIMIHELSHAYHSKMLEDGYENKEIKECFDKAMEERLYDWVRVKGTQGPMAKAYACSNCMEYFAELSAAFLGGTDDKEMFNKWYPFNRRQIREHDPRAYEMLKRVWKVNCE